MNQNWNFQEDLGRGVQSKNPSVGGDLWINVLFSWTAHLLSGLMGVFLSSDLKFIVSVEIAGMPWLTKFVNSWPVNKCFFLILWETLGLSVRAITHNMCCGWVFLMAPWCYCQTFLLLTSFTHKVTSLLWVRRSNLDEDEDRNLMAVLDVGA